MFETLFGAEMPLAVRFFLAFLIVLGLIGAAAWMVRRFGSGRYGGASQRGRQPRLAVIDHASVDARRRLILIRRDNIEHLLLIGGPTDIVVEANIVRAVPSSREPTLTRPSAAPEPLARALALPESEPSDSWPLQPEPVTPAPAPRRAPRIEPVQDEAAPSPPKQPAAESAPYAPRENLASLADSLAFQPVSPPRSRPAAAPARPPAAAPRIEPRPEQRAPAHTTAETPSAVDQSLAEMAHRLEAALRKPKPADARESSPPAAAPRVTSSSESVAEAHAGAPAPASGPPPAAAQPRLARVPDPKPRPDTPAKEGKALYDSLEQEMASLLGRPANKA